MSSGSCKKCGTNLGGGSFLQSDYCAICKKHLCPDCMAKGCCDRAPAWSGAENDIIPRMRGTGTEVWPNCQA